MNRVSLLAPLAALQLAACATSQEAEQPEPWPVPDTHCASTTVLLDRLMMAKQTVIDLFETVLSA